eukprot:1411638-Pyramimonas_sp.AAC.1
MSEWLVEESLEEGRGATTTIEHNLRPWVVDLQARLTLKSETSFLPLVPSISTRTPYPLGLGCSPCPTLLSITIKQG